MAETGDMFSTLATQVPTNTPSSGEGRAIRQSLLQSGETMATVVNAMIRSQYGDEAYWWDPLTVALEIKADFGVDPCPEVMDRWSAMQVVMTGDSFFTRIDSFFAVCNALSGGDPFFGAFDPVTVEEAAWAIAEVGMNRDMLPFSDTIRGYCSAILKEAGYGDSDRPPAFDPVFKNEDGDYTIGDAQKGLASEENGASLRGYLMDNVNDLASQLDSIPDMEIPGIETLRDGLAKAVKG